MFPFCLLELRLSLPDAAGIRGRKASGAHRGRTVYRAHRAFRVSPAPRGSLARKVRRDNLDRRVRRALRAPPAARVIKATRVMPLLPA